MDTSGNTVASYEYNGWGEVLKAESSGTSDIAEINPIRYRGYYYDAETGLYYLCSRYYNPIAKRFINADKSSVLNTYFQELINKNLYTYCDNNPIMRYDETGDCWLTALAVGFGTQYVTDIMANVSEGKRGLDIFSFRSTKGDYLASIVTAFISGSSIGAHLLRETISIGIKSVEKRIKGKKVNLEESIGRGVFSVYTNVGVDELNKKVSKYVSSKTPKKYSYYAKRMAKKNVKVVQKKFIKRW